MKPAHEQLNEYLMDNYGIKLTEECAKDILHESVSLSKQLMNQESIDLSHQEFDLMIIGCFRYALGRMTYIVSETVDFIISKWDYITKARQELMVSEIRESIERGTAGHECDIAQWKRILELSK